MSKGPSSAPSSISVWVSQGYMLMEWEVDRVWSLPGSLGRAGGRWRRDGRRIEGVPWCVPGPPAAPPHTTASPPAWHSADVPIMSPLLFFYLYIMPCLSLFQVNMITWMPGFFSMPSSLKRPIMFPVFLIPYKALFVHFRLIWVPGLTGFFFSMPSSLRENLPLAFYLCAISPSEKKNANMLFFYPYDAQRNIPDGNSAFISLYTYNTLSW